MLTIINYFVNIQSLSHQLECKEHPRFVAPAHDIGHQMRYGGDVGALQLQTSSAQLILVTRQGNLATAVIAKMLVMLDLWFKNIDTRLLLGSTLTLDRKSKASFKPYFHSSETLCIEIEALKTQHFKSIIRRIERIILFDCETRSVKDLSISLLNVVSISIFLQHISVMSDAVIEQDISFVANNCSTFSICCNYESL